MTTINVHSESCHSWTERRSPFEVTPVPKCREVINSAARAQMACCDTCGVCVAECPVNRATNRLQPRTLVRMANLGQLEELLLMRQIWYCISCNRCEQICPMGVKPTALIAYARLKAVRRRIYDAKTSLRLQAVHRRLHRVRRQLLIDCLKGEAPADFSHAWTEYGETPIVGAFNQEISLRSPDQSSAGRKRLRESLDPFTDFSSCFTCNECRNACPACHEFDTFDPL